MVSNGQKVIDALDKHFSDAYSRHNEESEKQTVHIVQKEVEITNSRRVKQTYWTYCIVGYENFIDYEDGDLES